jgi:hypothetical protein
MLAAADALSYEAVEREEMQCQLLAMRLEPGGDPHVITATSAARCR